MIIAAADGSALGNPGPAGWAWYVDDGCWASGGWPRGTNNMGELMAVLDLLQQTAHVDDELHVFCDSKYVIDSVTKWMPGWKRKGWKKSDGKPVLNVELMKALDAAMEGRRDRVRFEWVKGHAGHELNEAADVRANAAASAYQRGVEPDPGPGFVGGSSAHPAATVGQVEEEPDLFSDVGGRRRTCPTRSTSSRWSARCSPTRCAPTGPLSPRCCTPTGRRSAGPGGSGRATTPSTRSARSTRWTSRSSRSTGSDPTRSCCSGARPTADRSTLRSTLWVRTGGPVAGPLPPGHRRAVSTTRRRGTLPA